MNLKAFLYQRQGPATWWIDAFETPLQKACSCGQLDIVKKLLLDEMTGHETPEDTNYRQSLALDIAAGNGNLKIIEDWKNTNPELLLQDNSASYKLAIPVVRASNAGHEEVTRYLYKNYRTDLDYYHNFLRKDGRYWATCLLRDAIFYGFLGKAFKYLISRT